MVYWDDITNNSLRAEMPYLCTSRHGGWVTGMCVSKLGHSCFRWGFADCSAPSRYLNHCCLLVNWAIKNKIWIKTRPFSYKKMRLKISSAKRREFRLATDVLILEVSRGFTRSRRLFWINPIFMMTHQMETFSALLAGPLCGEFTGYRWIPLTKASDAEFWCFLLSAPE